MPVLRRKDITGPALAFVTTTVTDWLPVFEDDECARLAALQLGETAATRGVDIMAYVVMPSHLHAALGVKEVSQLDSVMQAYKSLSSRKLDGHISLQFRPALYQDGSFRLWKRRFDDLIIYSRKQFKRKLDYIHDNPVRAGLVNSPTEWVYSSARDWLFDEKGLIEIDKDFSWLVDE